MSAVAGVSGAKSGLVNCVSWITSTAGVEGGSCVAGCDAAVSVFRPSLRRWVEVETAGSASSSMRRSSSS
jgi:hypothetical protein